MLDCGFSLRETVSRLARAGLAPSDLSGIIVTHEHADHGEGVFALARRFGIRVWLTHGTLAALREGDADACNYDSNMLTSGPYPAAVKSRIASRFGHLDNRTSGEILAALDCSRLRHVIAAHLSQTNNTPERARAALAEALGCEPAWIEVATQDEGFSWRDL